MCCVPFSLSSTHAHWQERAWSPYRTHQQHQWTVFVSLCVFIVRLSVQVWAGRLLDGQGLHGGVQEHLPRPLPVPETGHLRCADGQFSQRGQGTRVYRRTYIYTSILYASLSEWGSWIQCALSLGDHAVFFCIRPSFLHLAGNCLRCNRC